MYVIVDDCRWCVGGVLIFLVVVVFAFIKTPSFIQPFVTQNITSFPFKSSHFYFIPFTKEQKQKQKKTIQTEIEKKNCISYKNEYTSKKNERIIKLLNPINPPSSSLFVQLIRI